jgi:hypothetical protein
MSIWQKEALTIISSFFTRLWTLPFVCFAIFVVLFSVPSRHRRIKCYSIGSRLKWQVYNSIAFFYSSFIHFVSILLLPLPQRLVFECFRSFVSVAR